jgi:hypothetical protein
MDFSFQQIVIIVAVILLIVTSTVIGYMMYSIEKMKPWPPASNACPDGWTHDLSNNICKNTTGINVGSMITDISCGLAGSLTMTGERQCATAYPSPLFSNNNACISGWVQGNAANSRDLSSCYMLANSDKKPTSYTTNVSYTPSSMMQDNVDWAKAFDISWDGLA